MSVSYIFIIDTEQYSGNFEREMCAYITGVVGDCGVGTDEAEIFKNETNNPDESPFADFVILKADEDDGCRRPVTIYETSGWFNNGLGGYFKHGDYEEALAHYTKQKNQQGDRENWAEDDERRQPTKLLKCSAYLSVGIFMSRKPTDNEYKFLMKRAKEFATYSPSEVTITTFRLLKEETTLDKVWEA